MPTKPQIIEARRELPKCREALREVLKRKAAGKVSAYTDKTIATIQRSIAHYERVLAEAQELEAQRAAS